MLNDSQQQVLKKVIDTLQANHIPYQITGGLAASIYGSKRSLYDIDIDVYKKDMAKVRKLFEPFLIKDMFHCEQAWWNGWLMIFKIGEALIDISQVEEWYAVNPNGGKKHMTATPQDALTVEFMGMRLSVVRKDVLIAYKKHMARATDLEDVRQIMAE